MEEIKEKVKEMDEGLSKNIEDLVNKVWS